MKSWGALIGLALVVVVVGCAGSTGGVGGTSSSGGGGGTSGSGTGSADETADGGLGCSTPAIEASRACVPKDPKANAPLTVEIESKECLACGATIGACEATVDGTKITLTLHANQCAAPADGCSKECRTGGKTTCTIPPLAKGSYRLELADSVRTSVNEPRQLTVGEGNDASCALPPGEPPPIQASDYPQQCSIPTGTGPVSEPECALVIEGDVCQPCRCPTAAIHRTAIADYNAEINARRSACDQGGSPSCAPCPQTLEAKCIAGQCKAVPK